MLRRLGLSFVAILLFTTAASAQTTYTWNQTGSALWTTSTNWTPTRTTPAADDVLVFNNGATTTATAVTSQTIGQLLISGNTNVTLQADPAAPTPDVITVAGGTGDDLTVTSGSVLNVNTANALTIALNTGTTGIIGGSVAFAAGAHKLTSAIASGITFQSNSVFTSGTGVSGAPLGTVANSVVFFSGSTYVFIAGTNPFPASQFQTGSLFSNQGSGTPSFSGRTYGNFEQKTASTTTVSGGSAVVMGNLTITQGTLNFNMTGNPGHTINGNIDVSGGNLNFNPTTTAVTVNVKGNITVAATRTLGFNPTVSGNLILNGTVSSQTITNNGTLNIANANQTITIDNANGVSLLTPLALNNGALALTNGIVNATANLLSIGATTNITRTNGYVHGAMKHTFAGAGSKVFPVGTPNGYSPVTANVTSGTFPADLTSAAVQGPQPNMNAPTSLQRYWTLTASGPLTANLTFKYLNPDVAGIEANYQLARVNAGVPTFFAGTVDAALDTASLNGVSSFSDWTAGEPVDNTPPAVTSVSVPADSTYLKNQNLDFTVNFSENVNVGGAGTPRIPISLTTGTVHANYLSGSGTSALVFRYSVANGDMDLDGISLGGAIDVNGGTMRDAALNNADATLNAVGPTSGILVDTSARVVSINRSSAENPTNDPTVDFTVTFDEAVSNVDSSDFTVTATGAVTGANASSVAPPAGPSTVYTISVATGSGDGTIRLDLPSGHNIIDATLNLANTFNSGETFTIDETGPVVTSIVRAAGAENPTNDTFVDFTVTFNEAASGVDNGDFTATATGGVTGQGVPNPVTGGPTVYTVSAGTGSGDGTVGLDFNANSVTDALGNTSAAQFSSTESFTIDKTGPTAQSIVRKVGSANPTNASTVDFTVAFGEVVTGVDISDFSLDTTGVSGATFNPVVVDEGGGEYTVTVNTGTGSGTISVDLVDNDTILDALGNTLTAGLTNGEIYDVDKSFPTVVSINRADSNPTNDTDVNFTVTFSTQVTGVDASDFDLVLSGVTAAINTVASSDGGTTWNVNVNTVSGNGTIGLNLDDDDTILNGTSTPLGGTGAGNGSSTGQVYDVDQTAPAVQSSVRAVSSPTNASSVDFTITFSEAVSGVWTGDFSLNTSGVAGASVTGVSGSGTTYTVTVNTGSGDGTIRCDVVTGGTVIDSAGNPLAAGFTSGETYTVDKTAPTVLSSVRTDASPTGSATVDFTVTFSETVSGVDTSDFTLTNSGVTGASVTGVAGSGPYTVSVNTGSGSGTIRLDVLDNDSVVDAATNALNGAFNTGEAYTIERAPLAPASLAATPGNNTVGLTWNAANGAATYNVKRSPTDNTSYTTLATGVAVTSYDDLTAVNGTTYFYKVSATNGQGEGPDSNEVSATPSAPVAPASVVISQVYGGGGSSTGSPAYTNDYVELFNRGGSTADITGYSVQYGSSTGQFGSSATNIFTFPATTTIAAGKYLLVKLGSTGTAGGTFSADITTTNLSMSASSGKIALVTSGTALGCGATATPCTLPDARIVDLVAWGAANNGEGGTTANNGVALDSTKGAIRKLNGCQETNNNNNDFTVATTATGLTPRTSAALANDCSIVNNPPTITAPANPITSVAQDAAPFTVTLSGSDDGGVYTWSATPGSGVQTVTVSGGQGTPTVTYTVTLVTGFSGTATFTATLTDSINTPASQGVNIQVTGAGGNNAPIITAPANPIATVIQDAAPFTVSLAGSDDGSVFNWSATPGTGVATVTVTGGQGTASVTYTVQLSAGYSGTATFTATLSDNVNPSANQAVNISVTPSGAAPNHITISQIYGGGGNTGATFKNDYVELYNPTASPINVGGWSIQYGSSSSTIFSGIQPIGGTIGPGQYYLIALGTNGAVGSDLPTPNISGSINMSATNGKVVLASNGNAVDAATCGATQADPDLVDFVGYGSANCSEGNNNAPAASNSTADFRQSGGATDTNNNGSDFFTGVPNPRTTTPIQEIGPFVLSTDPISNASSAPRDASVIVFFTEAVDVSGAWYDINCATTGTHNDATVAAGAPYSWVVTPNTNFQAAEVCTVTIFKDFVRDSDTDDSAPGTDFLSANYSWSFTVATGTAPAYPSSVHLTMGNPSDADGSQTNNYLMTKPEFSLSYSRSRGTPNWVSWHLADEWVGTLTRVDTFRPDPEVDPSWYRVLASDYFSSGFDRGHMVPNADRDKETSIPINQATFLMTNMIPQAPDNNQGPWADLENDLRLLLGSDELYIVAGGVGTGGTGSNGAASTIANGNVTVPAQTWKVALILPKASGDDVARVTASTRTLAVLMPNVQGIRNNNWQDYITTVDAVEALTGYDFFENVPDPIEQAIEGGTNGVNPPGAANETITPNEDVLEAFTLDAVSPSNGTLTYEILTNPTNGILGGSGASRTYTSNADFNGTDSFTFRVNDGTANSNTATVSITVREVNDPPSASNDSKGATQNTPLVFTASDLTTNDSAGPANESTQTLTVSSVTATVDTHGTVSLDAGQITYTPDAGYSGAASFSYSVCDNGMTNGFTASLCASATVNLTVTQQVVTHFSVSAPVNVTNGIPFNVTVTALDASNATAPGYTGTVHFTSTSTGTLPADYTFVAGDNGAHTFSVTLSQNGTQTLTATDTLNASINGTAVVSVNCPAAPQPHLTMTAGPSVCASSTGAAAASLGFGTYTWEITNGTITAGQGTRQITYTAGVSGSVQLIVRVGGTGPCDPGQLAGAAVPINTAPDADLPEDIYACNGTSVQITARLTGTAPFTVRWADGLVQQTSTRNTTRTVVANDSITYTIDSVSDASCTRSDMHLRIRVIGQSRPVILDQTENVKINRGETATLSIGTSTFPGTIEWFEGHVGDTSKPVGTVGPSFITPELQQTTFYWARLTTACGSLASDPMMVQVGGKSRAVRH